MIAGVVWGAVDDLVGRDDDYSGEGRQQTTPLQDPVPADLGGTRPHLGDGRRPWGEEENGFRHQHSILEIMGEHQEHGYCENMVTVRTWLL